MPQPTPNLAGKSPSESRTSMTEMVLPNDANTHGNILGGRVMHLIDIAGAMAANRHCRQPVVTVSVDSLVFHHPIRVGALILLEAWVNRTFHTSMEVEVHVCSEELRTGKRQRTSTAFLTFVALGPDNRPAPIPPLVAETDIEKLRYEAALRRRHRRLRDVENEAESRPHDS